MRPLLLPLSLALGVLAAGCSAAEIDLVAAFRRGDRWVTVSNHAVIMVGAGRTDRIEIDAAVVAR